MIHFAVVNAAGDLEFDFQGQQRAFCKRLGIGTCVDVEIREHRAKRSSRQNRALHAMLTPWAKARGWNPDHLKLKMLEIAFGSIEEVEPLTNRVVSFAARPHSSGLNVTEFCHLIEEVLRVAAEDGFWIESPDEYRRAKEEAEKQRQKSLRRQVVLSSAGAVS